MASLLLGFVGYSFSLEAESSFEAHCGVCMSAQKLHSHLSEVRESVEEEMAVVLTSDTVIGRGCYKARDGAIRGRSEQALDLS